MKNLLINKINKDGTLVEEISTKNSSYNIPDIATYNNNLYYLRYSEKEPVVKINLSNYVNKVIKKKLERKLRKKS